MTPPTVFISYSHRDKAWVKDWFLPRFESNGFKAHIDYRDFEIGVPSLINMERAVETCEKTILVFTPDWVRSEFAQFEAILLQTEDPIGVRKKILPLMLRDCQPPKRLKIFTYADFRDKDEWGSQLRRLKGQIRKDMGGEEKVSYALPEKVDIARLPETGFKLFGRQEELRLLNRSWENGDVNVISFVAYGGTGKSTLVNKWLEKMRWENFRGAHSVYAWSFYSQGTGERVTSADQFIAEALAWFGDPDPTEGSPWAKGQRLADLVRREKTLLVLDGLEPLQAGYDYERGRIKDPALGTLVKELARDNDGLCLITTRAEVADLKHCPETTVQKNLEQISAQAGRALLRVGGVRGSDAELEAASRAFGNHALALNLLAAYLDAVPGHPIDAAKEIPDLPDVSVEDGKHPRRVMAALAERFAEAPPPRGGEGVGGWGPELELLHLLGLFDRPAGPGAIAALREPPPIPGLTDHIFIGEWNADTTDAADSRGSLRVPLAKLQKEEIRANLSHSRHPRSIAPLDEAQWLRLVERLRAVGLLAPKSSHRPKALDAHPLVREHFGQQLRGNHPDAWREANQRLYQYYQGQAPHQPDTLEEMGPLFTAVAHGCAAQRYQEVLIEIYSKRIRRKNDDYNVKKLGAFGSSLAAISNFFDSIWSQTVDELRDDLKAFVLNQAGFHLRALGRLAEAAEPMQAAVDNFLAQENWKQAAASAGNLSELHLTRGDVPAAVEAARQSVDLADQSGDDFLRMANRTALADALHQAGQLDEAEALFEEAERMQKERQPSFPLLYSQGGYRYCGLLLGQGAYGRVRERATMMLELAEKYLGKGLGLLDIGLGHLAMGRALAGNPTPDPSPSTGRGSERSEQGRGATSASLRASHHLHRAVDGLRQAGHQDDIPRGLLARAAFYRAAGKFERAQRDLDEAMVIATRGGMRLHECDAHVGYARLYVAVEESPEDRDLGGLRDLRGLAEEHLAAAKALVDETGYHRRDAELAELEKHVRDTDGHGRDG